jgi:hypothetical protein
MSMVKKGRPAHGSAGVCTSTSRVWDANQARKTSEFAFCGNFTCVADVLVPGQAIKLAAENPVGLTEKGSMWRFFLFCAISLFQDAIESLCQCRVGVSECEWHGDCIRTKHRDPKGRFIWSIMDVDNWCSGVAKLACSTKRRAKWSQLKQYVTSC